jgi:imidazolonepropionase-like amidohydrolase
VGPRILTAGSPISTTGTSRTGRFAPGIDEVVGPDGVCNGAQDCAREVREQVAGGADVINFYDSGSIGELRMIEQAMTDDEMQAVVQTAHALGRKVVADGHTAAAVNAALRARADIIDTAPWADAQSFELMKRQGAFLEPHLYAFVVSVQDLRSGSVTVPDSVDSPIVARLQGVLAKPFAAQLAHERGVQLAYGSDTGIVRHGDNVGELLELVRIGLTPMQAIEVATRNSAVAIGLAGEIGSLEAGKRADLIAVDRNPLDDIEALRHVTFVMRDGHGLKQH